MNSKRILALVLILAMVLCAVPVVYAVADDPASGGAGDIPINPDDIGDAEIGDVNGDGNIDEQDANLLLQYLADDTIVCDWGASDVNQDSMIDNLDAICLLRFVAGNIPSLDS